MITMAPGDHGRISSVIDDTGDCDPSSCDAEGDQLPMSPLETTDYFQVKVATAPAGRV